MLWAVWHHPKTNKGYGACQPRPRSYGEQHPNDGMVKPVISARDVASPFAREHMLAQSLLAEPAFYPSCAHRTHFLLALPHSHVPVMGVWGPCRTKIAEQWCLSTPHAPPAATLPAGTCSPILSFHRGYGGFAPMLAQTLDLPPPTPPASNRPG